MNDAAGPHPDLLLADATSQLAALAARKVSAVELLELALARHRDTHGVINAVIRTDPERALDAARATDRRRARGEPLGPLAGLPMTIKDTFDVSGMAASSGLAALQDREAADAACVARARRAGAVIWGKTNVPAMAADWQSRNALHGTTRNPWDPSRTPGGSSGGAAAALAAGLTALEIGSDIAGSLRVPASFCGVFSHKPTWGRIPQHGHVPPGPGALAERDLNVVGPMARSARDLQLLMSILDGADASARTIASLEGLRVGLWIDEPDLAVDPAVQTVIRHFGGTLVQAGAQLRPVRLPVQPQRVLDTFRVLLGAIMAMDLPPRMQRRVRRMRSPAGLALKLGMGGAAARMIRAYTATHAEWLAADEARAGMRHQVERMFEKVDVVIAPVAPVVAFEHDKRPLNRRQLRCSDGSLLSYDAMSHWIALASACHLPVTTVPAGRDASGMPVGVQVIGPRGADHRTLAVARAIEECLGGFEAPPTCMRDSTTTGKGAPP
ncbi:amidase [Ramlibacter henchirensis]|uniref:Amidase n=1 Tax=Ramlibacter henchirensis TaxID=204072 RepID=A0A4Z0C752_9BURK|nr:amidase family protein [Ramlibacter henchirensis]TFZ05919.1 amidase [Ramlibacter henchirensis]